MEKKRNIQLSGGKTGAALVIRITPRMTKNEISEIMDNGTVKIKLTAPPVEGKANRALIKFLAEILDVPTSKLAIVAGLTSRDKLVTVLDLEPIQVQKRIHQYMAGS
jgi:uncharacterized protein (TIGR00251 family)